VRLDDEARKSWWLQDAEEREVSLLQGKEGTTTGALNLNAMKKEKEKDTKHKN
jgi:hypothetical protein